jgi:peptide/nickel transport system substrate-binding protein
MDGNGDIIGQLAEDWDISSDGLTYTFNLREGVKFHSGNELTAEDVKYSMDRMTYIGEGRAHVFEPYVESVEVVDTYTVQFNMKAPFGPFVSSLPYFYVVDKATVEEHVNPDGPYGEYGDYGTEWTLTNDAGSGPYKVKEFSLEEKLVMERFDEYWGETLNVPGWGYVENAPDFVEMIGTTEAITVRTMMARQELEMTDVWQTDENLAEIAKEPGAKIISTTASWCWYLMINTQKAPTDDIYFRKFLTYAFDYVTATTDIMPNNLMANSLMSDAVPGRNTNLEPQRMDLDKALEALEQSEYYDTIGDYEIEVQWSADVPVQERVMLMYQDTLDDFGIKLKIMKTPWLSIIEKSADAEVAPQLSYIGVGVSYPEAGGFLMRYHSSKASSWMCNEFIHTPELDELIEASATLVDTDARYAAYHELEEYIYNQYCTIAISQNSQLRAVQDYVEVPK